MQKSNKQSKRRSVLRPGHLNTLRPVRFLIQGASHTLQQATSGNGGFTSYDGSAAAVSLNSVRIDPFSFGARLKDCASLFNQWRVHRMVIRYVPFESASGVVNTGSAGTTASPSYGNRTFAWCQYTDSVSAPTTFSQAVADGAQVCNTSRPCELIPRNDALGKWLFTTETTSSPAAIDERMVCIGGMSIFFLETSSTNTTTFGMFVYDVDVSFRGMCFFAAPLASPAPPSDWRYEHRARIFAPKRAKDEDEKTNKQYKTAVLSAPSSGWFGQ